MYSTIELTDVALQGPERFAAKDNIAEPFVISLGPGA